MEIQEMSGMGRIQLDQINLPTGGPYIGIVTRAVQGEDRSRTPG